MPEKRNLIERRFLPVEGAELRADDVGHKLAGYAAVFGVEAIILGAWREEVAPGAYAKTIFEHDIRALWNHDPNIVLGRNRAGTLRLFEDGRGLNTEIDPPDNEWGRPVFDAVARGDVTGMSISFLAVKQEWQRPPEGSRELPKRVVREAKLYDVSPVTFPAFESATIGVRSAELGLPENAEDAIEIARQLVRCSQRGMVLTVEDRRAIAVARDILLSCLPTAEPGAQANHSAEAQRAEPEGKLLHHSAAWRVRELQLLDLALN